MNKRLMVQGGGVALDALQVRERELSLAARYNIAPGDELGAVWTPVEADGARWLSGFGWGVSPQFRDESDAAHRLYSARAESVATKATWAQSFKFRRAVVPLDGFWMWGDVDGTKRPFLIHDKSGAPLYVAALWQPSELEGARELALISVESNRLVAPFGARMPALLRGDDLNLWLEPNVVSARPLQRVLKTVPARDLRVRATDLTARGRASLDEAADARAALTWIYGPEFNADHPRFPAKRRHVTRESEAGGHVFFKTRSFTRDDATRWHPVVDIECGHVFCDCPDFRYRHAPHEPDVSTPQWWCKHLARAVANCRRHGELPLAQ